MQFGAFLERERTGALDVQRRHLNKFVHGAGQLRSGPAAGRAGHRASGRSPASRSFYRHLRREEAIERDPTADLRAPSARSACPTS